MPHNSVFVLGSRSNARWLHGVRADKRPQAQKSEEERAYGGQRISLTFRNIGTFTNRQRTKIWGQGAKSKFQATAGNISTANNAEMETMIRALSNENQQPDFDWDAEYGSGFDVINLVVTKAPTDAVLFLCKDELSNLRVKMAIKERRIDCRMTKSKPPTDGSGRRSPVVRRTIFSLSGDENPLFRDSDANQSESIGDLPILFYISRFYPAEPDPGTVSAREVHRAASNVFARITQANELLFLWQEMRGTPFNASTRATHTVRRLSTEPSSTTTTTGSTTSLLSRGSSQSPSPSLTATSSVPSSTNTITAASLTSTLINAPPGALPLGNPLLHPTTGIIRPQHRPSSISSSSTFLSADGSASASATKLQEAFEGEMEVWEEYAEEAEFISGEMFTIVDCGFWPVLNELVRKWGGWSEKRYPNLASYWRKIGGMDPVWMGVADKGDEGPV